MAGAAKNAVADACAAVMSLLCDTPCMVFVTRRMLYCNREYRQKKIAEKIEESRSNRTNLKVTTTTATKYSNRGLLSRNFSCFPQRLPKKFQARLS